MEIQPQENEIIIWLLVILVAMVLMAVLVIVIAGTSFRRILKHEEEKHALRLAHQQQLLKSSIQAQEKERQRIAADLHDELASRLSVARLTLQLPEQVQQKSEKKPIELIDKVLEVARNISHDLNPPLLEKNGLVVALTDFLQPLQHHYKLSLHISGEGKHRFDSEIERQVFRAVQESVQNAIKHAGFSHLSLILRITPKMVAALVKDDGEGFDSDHIKPGAGLKGIESRMQIVNGKFRVKSRPNGGTAVLIIVKL